MPLPITALLVLTGVLFAVPLSLWLASRMQPNDYIGIRTQKSMRSRWVWKQAHKLATRWSFWVSAATAPLLWLLPLAEGVFAAEYVPVALIITSTLAQLGGGFLAVRRFDRQYTLWRQLGYKHPPTLEEQATKLEPQKMQQPTQKRSHSI